MGMHAACPALEGFWRLDFKCLPLACMCLARCAACYHRSRGTILHARQACKGTTDQLEQWSDNRRLGSIPVCLANLLKAQEVSQLTLWGKQTVPAGLPVPGCQSGENKPKARQPHSVWTETRERPQGPAPGRTGQAGGASGCTMRRKVRLTRGPCTPARLGSACIQCACRMSSSAQGAQCSGRSGLRADQARRHARAAHASNAPAG